MNYSVAGFQAWTPSVLTAVRDFAGLGGAGGWKRKLKRRIRKKGEKRLDSSEEEKN
jgi:hypothetical protein